MLRQDEAFLRGAFHRALLPCMLSILSGNINILVDGILVGQKIGTAGLSAISLCVPVYLILCVIGSFLVSGTAIQASKAIGRQQTERSQRLYSTAFRSCLLASIVMLVAGILLSRPLSALLCPDKSIRPLVWQYTSITMIGALPKILIYIPFWFLRMDGRTKLVACMMLVMSLGNVVLDLIFLYPLNLGVAGAALASVIATAVACALGFFWLKGRESSFHLGQARLKGRDEWKKIAADGSPSALNNLLQTLRVLAVNSLLMWAGGSELVAVFTAVNCISAFSLAVVDGVPQAASAMLGIYNGERDSGSTALLVKLEMRTGLFCCAIFAAAAIAGARLFAFAYGLPSGSLDFAMVCLSAGMFPALACSILCGYYNISSHVRWANAIIFSRVFLFAAVSLYLVLILNMNPWWFLIFSELVTLILWYLAVNIYHARHRERTRCLLMDRSLEESGQVLNFSVAGNDEDICLASDRITGFCTGNLMEPRHVMRFGLAIEEVMTMIVRANESDDIHFDVRVFSLQGTMGIRIRYDGKQYNPFESAASRDEEQLGIQLILGMMDQIVYQRTFGVNTIQLLL